MAIATGVFSSRAPVATTRVRALFLHGPQATRKGDERPTPMRAVPLVEAVAGKGLRGDARYFRATTRNGSENLRQVSLIDEATLDRHVERFGDLPLELVKSQIVLAGAVRLPDLIDYYLVFGDGADAAVLQLTIPRLPCFAMDLIASGLRAAMEGGEQGALARVVRGGPLAVNQRVAILSRD